MKINIKEELSLGLAMGKLVSIGKNESEDVFTDVDTEIKKFDSTVSITLKEISSLKEKNPNLLEYLVAQELIVLDPNLKERTVKLINEGNSVAKSLTKVMHGYMDDLLKSSSEYLRERAQDVNDILERLLDNLYEKKVLDSNEKFILEIDCLFPSFLITHRDNILGVIAKRGGFTSHAAIMCRSFDIPLVIVDGDYSEYNYAIIDPRRKIVIFNPDETDYNHYNKLISKRDTFEKKAIKHDGYLFLANVSNNLDIDKVLDYGFDAIGLYRTEMIFMNSDRPYSFDEQYSIYKTAVSKMKDKFICFRTFDVGDDKQISYLKTNKKGIDNYIANPDIFEAQISAMMKANEFDNMRIMFPMIESNSEFEYLRDWVIRVQKTHGYKLPKIGMMLETKNALMNIESFIKADFISIGTNDLTKELYGIDRDKSMSEMKSHIEDMLFNLDRVIKFCNQHDKCLSVCGELASIKDVALKFYEHGIKNLSVSPSLIRMLNLSYDEFFNKK